MIKSRKVRTVDEILETRDIRRGRADDRYLEKIEAREQVASEMIGELSSGKFYVYPVGGRYREGSRADLIDFLIRNNYA